MTSTHGRFLLSEPRGVTGDGEALGVAIEVELQDPQARKDVVARLLGGLMEPLAGLAPRRAHVDEEIPVRPCEPARARDERW